MSDYLGRLLDAYRAGVFPEGVSHVSIEHAEGCPFGDRGEGDCTCEPRIAVTVKDEVLVIGTGGAILERIKVQ